MSQDQLIQAVADQVAELSRSLNRAPEDILANMRKHLLIEKLRGFVAGNRVEAEATGFKQADVEQWVEDDRREQRAR